MKTLIVLLAALFSNLTHAECFIGQAKDGSIAGLRQYATLYFQRTGSAGGRGAIATVDKRGNMVMGDVRCSGGAPDECRIGSDGGLAKLQFIGNVPTLVVQKGGLQIVGGDGDEQDLRAVTGKANGFNYPLALSEGKVCAGIFPHLRDVEPSHDGHPVPNQPLVNVPATR